MAVVLSFPAPKERLQDVRLRDIREAQEAIAALEVRIRTLEGCRDWWRRELIMIEASA